MVWIKDPEILNLWYASDKNNKCEITEHIGKDYIVYSYSIYHNNNLLIRGQSSTLDEAKEDCVKSYKSLIKNLKNFLNEKEVKS